MNLTITVGILADRIRHNPGEVEHLRHKLTTASEAMVAANHPAHVEPENCEVLRRVARAEFGWQALREAAGYIWQNQLIPRWPMLDGLDADKSEDLFQAAIAAEEVVKPSLWQRLSGKVPEPVAPPPFMHLSLHSDVDGYYLPVDFNDLVWPAVYEEETAGIWPIGSVQQLLQELATLGRGLEIADAMVSDDPRIIELLDQETSSPDGARWEAQPIVAHMVLILREACAASLATGAAIALEGNFEE